MRYMIFLLLILCSCSAINAKLGLADDNIIENSAEKVIESSIEKYLPVDVEIDFTPEK